MIRACLLVLLLQLPALAWTPQEILLEKAPAATVMRILAERYPTVKFTMHPTMNGFYVHGTRKDIMAIKADVPGLDQFPREFLPVRYGDLAELRALLHTLVPDALVELDSRLRVLSVQGPPGAVDQVRELLTELDRPTDGDVGLDCKVIDLGKDGRVYLGLPEDLDTQGSQVLERPRGSIITSPLQFLMTQADAKVLAAPRVVTKAGQVVEMHIGDNLTLTSFDPLRGEFRTDSVPLGLKLTLVATSGDKGTVTLKVTAQSSMLTDLISGQHPVLAERTYEQQLTLQDGDTVAFSGLMPLADKATLERLPLLADLPTLGTTSRSTRHSPTVMLTPRMLK